MKTSYGRIAYLAFIILIAGLLFTSMRAGEEDSMIIDPGVLKMSPGDSYRVRCALSSDDLDQRITFATDNDRVAGINPNGTVYAIASGEAVITAKASGGASASMQVIVTGNPMRTLTLNTDELRIKKGEISGLSVTYNQDATDARLQWVSADESIAKVSANGRILGVGGGMTTVSVLSPGGAAASANVYVDVDSIAMNITPNELTVGVGAKVALNVRYLPADSTDSVRRWSSSDSSIAYVDDQSVLHAVGTGKAYINAVTMDGMNGALEVIVERAPDDLQLSPARATIERGDEMDMQVLFINAASQVEQDMKHLVIWESSEPDVATVDQTGHVRALRGGMTRITASSDGHIAECQLRVAVSVRELKLSAHEVYLLKEQTKDPIRLTYTIAPMDPDDPSVRFYSDNEQVARVSEDGIVTMTGGYGTAVITAWNVSGAKDTFTVNVVVRLPEEESDVDRANAVEAEFGSIEDLEGAGTFGAEEAAAIGSEPTVGAEANPPTAGAFGDPVGTFGDGAYVPDPGAHGDAEDYTGENIYG